MQVFAVQIDIVWESRAENHRRVAELVNAAAPPAGSLIVLPEMFATGFSMHVDRVAEQPGGPTEAFVASFAAQHKCYVCAGLATRSEKNQPPFNQAVMFDPAGNVSERYAKQQLFTLGTERDYYQPGQGGAVVQCGAFTVAPRVCYDLRFPELFRADALAGAQLLVVIANWPQSRSAHWRALLQARAIENQAYVVGVNRVGRDPLIEYVGQSAIYNPRGELIAAADDVECVASATLDHKAVVDYRRKFPALSDTDLRHFLAVAEMDRTPGKSNA
jgi:predicted amidohydrolase